MKNKFYVLMTFIFLLSNNSFSQVFPKNENGDIEFTEIVECNLSKDKLFSNAKEWITSIFKDYKSVIQFEDNTNYKLIVKGNSNIDYVGGITGMAEKEKLSYTITIECKDNKYRYKINDVVVNQTYFILGSPVNANPSSPDRHLELIKKYESELDSLYAVDVSKMKKKALNKHNEDIEDKKRSINDEKTFYNKEYQEINAIVLSLKKSLCVKDDF